MPTFGSKPVNNLSFDHHEWFIAREGQCSSLASSYSDDCQNESTTLSGQVLQEPNAKYGRHEFSHPVYLPTSRTSHHLLEACRNWHQRGQAVLKMQKVLALQTASLRAPMILAPQAATGQQKQPQLPKTVNYIELCPVLPAGTANPSSPW